MATLHFVSGKAGAGKTTHFAGNTPRERAWVRSIFERANADHRLHYLPADDDICRKRVRQRNVSRPEGVFFGTVTDAQVDQVNKFFTPPGRAEGFEVIIHGPSDG
jgi:hypothetical protein